jgi:hypothetical protein
MICAYLRNVDHAGCQETADRKTIQTLACTVSSKQVGQILVLTSKKDGDRVRGLVGDELDRDTDHDDGVADHCDAAATDSFSKSTGQECTKHLECSRTTVHR